MKPRRGMTLLAVLLAIVVATAVLGVLGAAVSQVIVADQATHEHLQTVVTLGRLGEQFRRDAHQARQVVIEEAQDQPQRLILTGQDDATIEYEITPAGLRRVAQTRDEAAQRETYLLPGMTFLGWKEDDAHRELALLVGRLARTPDQEPKLRGQFAIVALLHEAKPPTESP